MMYTSPPDAVTLQAIYEAQRAIRGVALRTPLVPAPALAGNHREVRLKLETAQPTGAFKIRGAANAVARLPAEALRRGVVRSEEHTSELQSLMRISYAVFC